MRGIYYVTVENRSGVLSKTAGLFARRGFNIDGLTVAETENSEISNMTIISTGDERTLEQIEKQLNKMVDVIKVRRLDEKNCFEREAVLVKINYTRGNRREIMDVCEIMGAKIAHMGAQRMVVEYFGHPSEVESLINHLRPFGIQEVSRTGTLAMQKEN